MASYTKNQHYVPELILKRFSNNKNQVFEAIVEKNRLYQCNISSAMSQRDFYEHDLLQPNEVENGLQLVESDLSILIDKIIFEIKEKNCSDIDVIKKTIFDSIELFLIMYYRSYALIEEFQFTYDQRKADAQNSIFEMLEKIFATDYISRLAETIRKNYKLTILECNDEFLVSDQIVSTCSLNVKNRFFGYSNRQIGMSDILILIPLSSSYYICFSNQSTDKIIFNGFLNKIDGEMLDDINRVICNNSYNKCVSKNKDVLEKALSSYSWKSPSGFLAGGFKNGGAMGATKKKEVFYFKEDRESWEFFSSHSWIEFRELNRNDKCKCGSGKKFKKCCLKKFNECSRMMDDISSGSNNIKYMSSPNCEIEQAISHFDTR